MTRYSKPYVLIKQPSKSGKTIYYYRLRGEKTKHSSGCTRASDAHDFVDDLIAERKRSGASVTLGEYAAPFFQMGTDPRVLRKLEEGKPVGLEHLQNCRSWLKRYILPDRIAGQPLREIKRADVLEFRRRLLEKLVEKRTTANRVMEALKTIFREAVFQGDLLGDPTMGIGKVDTHRKERGTLTPAELQALWPARGLGPWKSRLDYTGFLLVATTGMRRGELMALKWADVDLENGAVVIQRAWKKAEDEDGATKSGRSRVVPLPNRTVKALEELREVSVRVHADDYVICWDDGSRVGESWWRGRFKAAMKAAEIDAHTRNITPHALRHTISTLLDREGQDPELIRDTFGWTTEQMRRHYLHRGAEHYRGQADIIDRLLGFGEDISQPPHPRAPD